MLTRPYRILKPLCWCCTELLFIYLVRLLPLNNGPAKAYLCNQGGKVALFLSRLVYHILNLANSHSIALIRAHIPTYHNVEADYLLRGRLVPEWHLLPHKAQVPFNFGIYQKRICWYSHVPINVSIITPWRIHYLWEVWGCMISGILGHITRVLCFLLLH